VTRSTPPAASDPAFRQQFGRSRGLLLGPAIALAAIGLWVGAVRLGASPPAPTPRPAVTAAAAVTPGRPAGSAVADQPTLPPPVLELFGPAPPGRVLIRDHELRAVDLATGTIGEPLGEAGHLDRTLPLADGGFACVCVRERARVDERTSNVVIEVFDPAGHRVASVGAGTWVGTDLPSLHQEPGPFSLDAAASADGRYLALATSLRRASTWVREVVVVDLVTATVTSRVALEAAPGAVGPRWAWAPFPSFSPDRSRLLLSGVELDEQNGPIRHRSWVLQLDGGRVTGTVPLRQGEEPADDVCAEAVPAFASDVLIVTLCLGDPYAGPFLRRDRPDGTPMRRVSLRDALKDSAAPFLLPDGRGNVFLWDAWSTRAIRVDAEEGVVAATTTMPDRGTPERFLDPSALLTPDGRQLVLAVVSGLEAAGTIHLLDAETLDVRKELPTEPGLMTLGVSGDGQWLHVGHAPEWNGAGGAEVPARIVVIDMATGQVRARLGQVGGSAFTIVGS
jgi:hypothetical protein